MSQDTMNIEFDLAQSPQVVARDELTEFIRASANRLLQAAVESEVGALLMAFNHEQTADGKQRVVRNGHLPSRQIQTGVGPVDIAMPRVRDRAPDNKEPVRFNSSLIPKYMRRTATLDVMLPLLYLKGISTNEFSNVLEPLLGEQAKSISPSVISRLKEAWYNEFEAWQQQDLSSKRYVYWWADGVYLKARMESEKNCMLVVVGVTEQGDKELVALFDGFRESKESWRSLLQDLQQRGLNCSPHLAIGDGGLGFWGALTELHPETKQQRCWVHKTANVLDKLPKSVQSQAKSLLHAIYLSDARNTADKAFDKFINQYDDKYPAATNCLLKDKDELMTFYQFPAKHWQHIRTTNPIESTFATVKHRTRQARGCFSRQTIVASTFKLLQEAEKRWLKITGFKQLADVIQFVKFVDGVDERTLATNNSQEAA